jgi:catechol 2,3-dioxygenase-like lactoylglutathione lyase family enzyme
MTDMNHVGVTVTDIDKAVDWYVKVFRLELLEGPMLCDLGTVGAARRRDVFGPRWGAMKLAHLLTANGAGLELFQFVDPPVESLPDNFTYWRAGPHHIALTVDDFNTVLQRLKDHGGRQRSGVFDVHGGAFICYCEDPWGNVVEIVSKSYRELSTATAQP